MERKRMALRRSWSLLAAACLLAGGAAIVALRPAAPPSPRVIERPDYVVYVPAAVDLDAQRPLVVALSPSGDARQMIEAWRLAADEFHWVVLASRRFRNGISGEEEWRIFSDIATAVRQGTLPAAIDRQRVLAAGFSGGGMGSHTFSQFFPDIICCVITNTGMMDAEDGYPGNDVYPRGKIAVFLASPGDFRCAEMQRDREFLDGLGWNTAWIEFEGGHVLAPASAYVAAARWIVDQWGGAPHPGQGDRPRD
jgi:hypothetical protein